MFIKLIVLGGDRVDDSCRQSTMADWSSGLEFGDHSSGGGGNTVLEGAHGWYER